MLTTAVDEGVGVFLVQGFVERTGEEEGVLTTAREDGDGVVAGTTADEEAAGTPLELPETAGEDD